MPRSANPVVLDRPQRAALTALERADSTPQKLAWRARIVLACAEGLDDTAAAVFLPDPRLRKANHASKKYD